MPCGASTSIQIRVYHRVSVRLKVLILLGGSYRDVSPFIRQWLRFGYIVLRHFRTSFFSTRKRIRKITLSKAPLAPRESPLGWLHCGYSQAVFLALVKTAFLGAVRAAFIRRSMNSLAMLKSSTSTMLYRRSIESVLCPLIFMRTT